jgi:DNA-binding response OmpR family regulator
MTKPFNMEELLARIGAIIRRSAAIPENADEPLEYNIGIYHFDYNKQKLEGAGEEHKLTTKESELLLMLCKYKNGVLERSHALKSIWGDDNHHNGRSMDVYVAKLRKFLKGDEQVEIINVHGRGFKLLAP